MIIVRFMNFGVLVASLKNFTVLTKDIVYPTFLESIATKFLTDSSTFIL